MKLLLSVSVMSASFVQAGIEWGWCQSNPPAAFADNKDFDADRYVGKWYEIKRDKTSYEVGTSCVTTKYTSRPEKWIYKIGVNNGAVGRDGKLFNGYKALSSKQASVPATRRRSAYSA